MSETRKEIIKNTLDAFLGVRIDEENNNELSNVGVAIDGLDTEILSDAIDQALEKEKSNENSNQS